MAAWWCCPCACDAEPVTAPRWRPPPALADGGAIAPRGPAGPLLCSAAVRTFPAAIVLCLGSAGCWNGELALHKPCENDDQCGRGQTCEGGFCDGPPASGGTAPSTSTSTAGPASTTDTGDICEPPTPTTCDPMRRPGMRALEAREIATPDAVAPIAVVAGDFVGDPNPDLAVLGFGQGIILFENTSTWMTSDSYLETQLTELVDLAVMTRSEVSHDFLVLSETDGVEVVRWNRGDEVFERIADIQLPMTPKQMSLDAFSLLAADVVGDNVPDLIVSTSTAIQVVPSVDGELQEDEIFLFPDADVDEPWDTLLVGTGSNRRILVPESDDNAVIGEANQAVRSFRIDGTSISKAGDLGTDFQNPWALAEGDFLGGDELEIVVAERRLNQPIDDEVEPTTAFGRLRFFRLVNDNVTEVGEPLEVGVGPRVLAAADLDCDGKTDLILGNSGRAGAYDGEAQVLFGTCDEGASADDLATVPAVGGKGLTAGSRMAVGDFDDDGLLEVAIPDLGDEQNPGARLVLVGVETP